MMNVESNYGNGNANWLCSLSLSIETWYFSNPLIIRHATPHCPLCCWGPHFSSLLLFKIMIPSLNKKYIIRCTSLWLTYIDTHKQPLQEQIHNRWSHKLVPYVPNPYLWEDLHSSCIVLSSDNSSHFVWRVSILLCNHTIFTRK